MVKWLVCLVLALMCAMWITPAAHAEDSITTTNDITDTQNLLGSNVSAVSDAMKRTEQETGVHVRLLYVDTFGVKKDASAWASSVLESTSPQPNTVLLAVASADGNLVVCVSSNSDEWLNNQKTIDALSDAAMQPLTKQGEQDWSGAATAMMDEIVQQKKTSTNTGAMTIGIVVMLIVLAVLVVVIVVAIVMRRRRGARKDAARATVEQDGKKAAVAGDADEKAAAAPDAGESARDAEPERPMTRRELREARKRRRGPFSR